MAEAPHKAEPRWAELSDDILESVEAGRKKALDAVRAFVNEISPAITDKSQRKGVIDAALNLAEELSTARIEFLRSGVRSAGQTFGNE